MNINDATDDTFPVNVEPHINARGRGWNELTISRPHAANAADDFIRLLRGQGQDVCRVLASIGATGQPLHPRTREILTDVFARLTFEVTPQTCEDLGRALIDAAEMATDPAYIATATATHDELVGA